MDIECKYVLASPNITELRRDSENVKINTLYRMPEISELEYFVDNL